MQGGLDLILGSSCSVSPGAGPGSPGFLFFQTLDSFLRKSMEGGLDNHSFLGFSVVLRNLGVRDGNSAHAAGSGCIYENRKLMKVIHTEGSQWPSG